jgi:pyrrolidone-carboxylate peptidase
MPGKFTVTWILIITAIAVQAIVSPVVASPPTVEEQRIEIARKVMSGTFDPMASFHKVTLRQWRAAINYAELQRLTTAQGEALWKLARQETNNPAVRDDRSLYWERLALTRIIRSMDFGFDISNKHRLALIERLENASRGRTDLEFQNTEAKHILITGFDPFLLDRDIKQSNPSGVLALLLDDQILKYEGVSAEINTVIFPVRYADFDAGELETLLAPYYALNSLDMVVTISMGRTQFDLEHFPGRRRSASAPDNLNVYSGGSETNPLVSRLHKDFLEGPEFVETSLPITAMLKAVGTYQINDRRTITTLEKTFAAKSLDQLSNAIAVRGGGGGYLSNEISYRSIRLRDRLGSTVPTGHIHTPKTSGFDPGALHKISAQLIEMLKLSLPEI